MPREIKMCVSLVVYSICVCYLWEMFMKYVSTVRRHPMQKFIIALGRAFATILKFIKIMTSMDYRGRQRADRRIASKLSSVDTFSGRNIIPAVELTGFIVCINCSGFPAGEGSTGRTK